MTRDQRARAAKQAKLFIDALEEFTDAAQYNNWNSERIIKELRAEISDLKTELIKKQTK